MKNDIIKLINNVYRKQALGKNKLDCYVDNELHKIHQNSFLSILNSDENLHLIKKIKDSNKNKLNIVYKLINFIESNVFISSSLHILCLLFLPGIFILLYFLIFEGINSFLTNMNSGYFVSFYLSLFYFFYLFILKKLEDKKNFFKENRLIINNILLTLYNKNKNNLNKKIILFINSINNKDYYSYNLINERILKNSDEYYGHKFINEILDNEKIKPDILLKKINNIN